MSKKYRIDKVVKATGLSKSTIIRYEETGLLAPPQRDGRGWRFYAEEDIKKTVSILKEKGLI
jgi:DNA-binding transcriptional MerR regulator